MFWIVFIISMVAIIISFIVGFILSLLIHGPESDQFWQTTILVSLATALLIVLLAKISIRVRRVSLAEFKSLALATHVAPPTSPLEKIWSKAKARMNQFFPK